MRTWYTDRHRRLAWRAPLQFDLGILPIAEEATHSVAGLLADIAAGRRIEAELEALDATGGPWDAAYTALAAEPGRPRRMEAVWVEPVGRGPLCRLQGPSRDAPHLRLWIDGPVGHTGDRRYCDLDPEVSAALRDRVAALPWVGGSVPRLIGFYAPNPVAAILDAEGMVEVLIAVGWR